MKALKFAALFFAVLFLNVTFVGNIAAQEQINNQPVAKKTSVEPQSVDSPTESQLSVRNQSDEKYRIGFQDTIEVQVNNNPRYSGTFNVNSDGTILMPRVDKPVTVVCKTERELSADIAALYGEILQRPFVNVRVVDQKSQPFAVIGAVEKPGSFYLNRRIRLLELIAFAGGPKVDKAGAKIKVARTGNFAGCVDKNNQDENADDLKILTFNVKDVVSGENNPWMQPGDIISVLEAEEAYVVGNVKKPTKVSLKEPVTLMQAIAAAEGLDDTAKIDRVLIQRQESNSPIKTELAFNLKDIRSKKIADPILQANDIVEVSNDGSKTLKKKIIDVFSGGASTLFLRVPL